MQRGRKTLWGAVNKRQISALAFAIALGATSLVQTGPAITSAAAALYTTNLAFHLDANNSSSYSGSGDTWNDLSGLGRNFTRPASGASRPVFQSASPKSFLFTRTNNSGGPPSNNAYFSGSNSWVGGNDFTVSAWIKTTNVGAGTQHWVMMHILSAESGGGAADWGFGVDSAGKLAFGIGPSDVTYPTSASVNTGNWTYVAATRTKANGVVRLYIDGALAYTSPSNSNTSTLQSNASMRLGAGDDGGVSFGGNIAAVYGYSAVLTDAQIAENFNSTKGTYGFTAPTTTTLTSTTGSPTFGATETLTATVSDLTATGSMNFLNNGSSISGCSSVTVTAGVARCPFIAASIGTFANLTAVYSGDLAFSASTSSAISIIVTAGTPSLTLTVGTTVPFRTNTSLVVTSSPAGTDGKVTFTQNGKRIAGCLKLQSTALSTTCTWKPSFRGHITVGATLTPTSPNFNAVSALPKLVFVQARTTLR